MCRWTCSVCVAQIQPDSARSSSGLRSILCAQTEVPSALIEACVTGLPNVPAFLARSVRCPQSSTALALPNCGRLHMIAVRTRSYRPSLCCRRFIVQC